MERSDPRLERVRLVLNRLPSISSLGEIYVGIDLDSALIPSWNEII